jgi:hypothetical protein
MHIHFGQTFNGNRSLTLPDSLGQQVLGPAGLLNLLETHLGLLVLLPTQSERIVQFRNVLNVCKEHAFYHKSFELDELGTARTLLQWRDTWYLHGWQGSFGPGVSEQLATMAEVEASAVTTVAGCEGQRLQAVLQMLEGGSIVPIRHISLYDEMESFPLAWRRVLERLPCKIVQPEPAAKAGTLLAQLQTALQQPDTQVDSFVWQDDASVRVVQADSPLLAAHWLAEDVRIPSSNRLLVTSAHSALLDDVLAAVNLPVQGLSELSSFRPALQVLPLVLQQLWKPVDVYALLELLTHPICPIPRFARRQLANLVADKPGINADLWRQTLTNTKDVEQEKMTQALAAVDLYLLAERYETRMGVPVTRLADLLSKLAHFFHVRLISDKPVEAHAYLAAHRQCSVFIRSLEALATQNVTHLNERQLQQLLDQATSQGSEHGLRQTHVGAMKLADSPASVAGSYDEVIWWQPVMPSLPTNYPWSPAQLNELELAGVILPPISEKLKDLTETWIRPLLAARHRLTLVLPSNEEEVHPIWLMLKALCPDIPVIKLEQVCLTQQQLSSLPVAAKPLPVLKRWWVMSPGAFNTVREKDSYSSLSQQLQNPAQWVLNYGARIRASQVQAIPDDFTLQGNVSHRLIELLFTTHGTSALNWDETVLAPWYDHAFNKLIDEEAAIFRMPGRHNACAVFHDQLYRAVLILLKHLRAAGVVTIQSECQLQGVFEGGDLAGSADLVLTLSSREAIILDMKWSGNSHEEKLKTNRQLQLAMYGEMYRQSGNAFARPAYFILSKARLLHVHEGVFPGVAAVIKEIGEQGPELWQRFLVTWRWRQAQLLKGEIEVASEAVSKHKQLEIPPESGYQLDKPSDRYNSYKHLMGWSADV